MNAPGRQLEDRMLSASRIMVNILAESLLHEKVHGLSAPQFRILDMVYNGRDKPAEVARMLDVSPPAITQILERLEQSGYIKRNHTAADRRRVVLELTGMGKDVVTRVNARRRRLLNRVVNGMEQDTVSKLVLGLESFERSYLGLRATKDSSGA